MQLTIRTFGKHWEEIVVSLEDHSEDLIKVAEITNVG